VGRLEQNISPDEERVKRYLEDRGFTVERFSKEKTRTGKTPDFRVFQNTKFLFYCEVKSSVEDRWLDEKLNKASPGKLVGGARTDPIYNRLTGAIHKAVQQFDAVNKSRKHPNVLAILNHDDKCGFEDLIAIITGNFYAADGTAHPIFRKFSHGRIKNEKEKIHLIIWLDDHGQDHRFFSEADETHHLVLGAAFGKK